MQDASSCQVAFCEGEIVLLLYRSRLYMLLLPWEELKAKTCIKLTSPIASCRVLLCTARLGLVMPCSVLSLPVLTRNAPSCYVLSSVV